MTLSDIVARCEKFSGYELEAETQERSYGRCLVIRAVGEAGRKHPYSLALMLHPDMSVLKELNGRLRHWGISLEEQRVIAAHLGAPEPTPEPILDPFAVVNF